MINRLCRFVFFRLLGWRQIGETPKHKKFVLVALPHTSNWDFIFGWMATRALDLNITIFAKDTFFIWPIGFFCRLLGVAPINRRENTNFVDALAQQYMERNELATLITPEGTRKFQQNLKSGYYYLAKKADIPIVVGGPDYKNRTFTLMPARPPLETFEEDEANLIAFCKSMNALKPQNTFR